MGCLSKFVLTKYNFVQDNLSIIFSFYATSCYHSPNRNTIVALARARDGVGNRTTSPPVTVNVVVDNNGVTLPSPWEDQDLGSVGVTGGAIYSNGTFIVQGSGIDLGGNEDAFHFVHRPWNGDGQIVARVVDIQNAAVGAKTGLMIRRSLAEHSDRAMMVLTSNNGAAFQYRNNTMAMSISTASGTETALSWLKLERRRDTLTGYKSDDGVNWEAVGSSTMSLGNTVEVGVVVSSQDNSVLCTSTLDNVSVVTFED